MLAALVLAGSADAAQEDDEEQQPYLPGLLATYDDAGGRQARRVDDAIALDWIDELPDERLNKSPITARWKGLLLAQGSGDYRLYAFATGEVEVRLAGKIAIGRQRAKEAWLSSEPLTLSFDHHPLEVEFRQTEPTARLALFWSGPQFGLEPIPPRLLWHDRKEAMESDFERGRLLASAVRCAACHRGAADPSPLPAPSLTNLVGNLERAWLTTWLMATSGSPARRMPSYGLQRDEAVAIAAFLLSPGKSPHPRSDGALRDTTTGKKRQLIASKKSGNAKQEKQEPPSARQGERLLLSLGCLACHPLGNLGESGLFGGGDLSQVAAKRPADFFSRWLADPAAINRQHRMPVFELTDDERTSLSLFLAQQAKATKEPAKTVAADATDTKLVQRGRALVEKLRCGACHELPGVSAKPAPVASVKIDERSDWSRSCAAARSESKTGLGYGLSAEQQHQLETYFRGSALPDGKPPEPDGALLLVTHNCLACHSRDGFAAVAEALPAKLADKLAAVGQAHDELAPLIPAMTPPSLNSLGDKLHDEALAAAIRRSGAAYRPYLLVRMPRFRLSDDELAAITRHFVTTDRIPQGAASVNAKPQAQAAALDAAGGRLVSTDGFGCVSCHQIGSVVPDKAPLNARGPGLSQIDARIRREWFDRFVANPARIVPRMEMPSVQIPVKGVLGDKVDEQLAAVWHVINTPGFEPPEPNPVRILRRSGIAERNEPPIVINDVVKIGERTFIHPLVLGLPNRQNFLYDLEEGRLAAWWLGDAARQRTKGKSWHWEPGGPMIMPAESKVPELAIVRGGRKFVPARRGQHAAELHGYRAGDNDVSFSYQLRMVDPDDPARREIFLRVSERWTPEIPYSATSYIRDISPAWTIEKGDQIEINPRPRELAEAIYLGRDETNLRLPDAAAGGILIHRASPHWTLREDGTLVSRPLPARRINLGSALTLAYRSKLAPDVLDAAEASFPTDADPVEVAPGFTGRRLPLPVDLMPTALGWHANLDRGQQELCIGSLKGQVVGAHDSDGDGLEDATSILADGLATPYGIHDGADALHVLTKSALLEIKQGAVEVLASGWGHTDDYHDWAVGLPRNEKGEYFIGLPCQQDERSAAAARHRSAVLKLTPRMRTDDNPLRYDLHVVSTGHRFPMGLALTRDGELFVTDNQGNYNPFNELNHVRQGAFFGFVNANEKQDRHFKAPPLAEPAIDIPHPWTRSVNGICFLDTPQSLRDQGTNSVFGLMEGHLVGCEYDTRRLIRMSLQKVGDTFQGASYPLSLEPSSPEKGFLGPVVCAISPRGELYVGSMRDSGWGAGNNVGEVVQVRIEPDKLPAGIAEVRTIAGGFEIDFFREVNAAQAADAANYSVSSYRRESTPAYGGPDLDRRIERVARIELAPDRLRVRLRLAELREGFVYELQVKNLTSDGSLFHPAEAHYTLRKKAE